MLCANFQLVGLNACRERKSAVKQVSRTKLGIAQTGKICPCSYPDFDICAAENHLQV